MRLPVLYLAILSAVLLSFLLSSCNYTPSPREVNYYTGIQGLELDFMENAPPEEVLEDSYFNINLFLENRGAFNVINENHAILSVGFDPYYVDASEIPSSSYVEKSKNSIILRGIQLPGKSRYYPAGSQTIIGISNFKTKQVQGQREEPSTELFASLCYPYTTVFSDFICVDMNVQATDVRRQVCQEQDLILADQGAPVAITRIEVENQPAGKDVVTGDPQVRPVFTIHLKNKGSGSVLSPVNNPGELDRVCSFQDLKQGDFSTVRVSALLSNSKHLICQPETVRLYGGEGFTRCQVSDEDLMLGYQNYQTSLSVNMSYVYLTSSSKEISIERLNPMGGSREPLPQCLPSEIQEGTACISKCLFCSQHPDDARCQPQNAEYHIDFQQGFACQCSAKKCNELYPVGLCVPFAGFCPGASYCCLTQCSSSEILFQGKCYPVCCECRDDNMECLCGTAESNYKIMPKDEFCCPDTSQSFTSKADCESACNQDT